MILAAWWNCGSARSRWVWGRNLNLRRDLTFATVGLLVVGGFGKNSQEESELLLLVVGGFGKNSQEEPELRGVSGFQVSRLSEDWSSLLPFTRPADLKLYKFDYRTGKTQEQ